MISQVLSQPFLPPSSSYILIVRVYGDVLLDEYQYPMQQNSHFYRLASPSIYPFPIIYILISLSLRCNGTLIPTILLLWLLLLLNISWFLIHPFPSILSVPFLPLPTSDLPSPNRFALISLSSFFLSINLLLLIKFKVCRPQIHYMHSSWILVLPSNGYRKSIIFGVGGKVI